MDKKRMGRYCKAYPVGWLKRFSGWTDALKEPDPALAADDKAASFEFDGSKYVFIQEDYSVTKGIYLNEGIVFDAVTPEWITFCHGELKFEIPARLEPQAMAGEDA